MIKTGHVILGAYVSGGNFCFTNNLIGPKKIGSTLLYKSYPLAYGATRIKPATGQLAARYTALPVHYGDRHEACALNYSD